MVYHFQHVCDSVGNMLYVKIYRIFFLFVFLKTVKSINGDEFKCGSSLDCPKGTYCYKDSALYKCAPCSNCMRFFRKNSTLDDCPQRPEQCGECIAGYYSPKLIDGTEPNTCISINSEILQPMEDINKKSLPPDIQTKEKSFGNTYLWLGLLGFVCIVSLAISAFYARRKCNRCNIKGSLPIINDTGRFCISPSAPPPPYQTAPDITSHHIEHETKPIRSTLPFASDTEINTTGGVRHHIDCEFDRRLQANCYKFPFYVNEGSLAPEHGEQAASREEENLPEIFDDTTQPSEWRPVAENLNKARRNEYYGGEFNPKILSTDIDDETEQQEGDNPEGNFSCEETRQFAMISSEHPTLSPSSDMSSSSNITADMEVQNFSTEPKHKKRRTSEHSEMNSFNLNIFINNCNTNVNENNNNM